MIVSMNESAGDTKIVKAVVLKPGYSPKSLLPKKVFKYDVHAVYNSYILNKYTCDVSKGENFVCRIVTKELLRK